VDSCLECRISWYELEIGEMENCIEIFPPYVILFAFFWDTLHLIVASNVTFCGGHYWLGTVVQAGSTLQVPNYSYSVPLETKWNLICKHHHVDIEVDETFENLFKRSDS